jgi:hypothetical protein
MFFWVFKYIVGVLNILMTVLKYIINVCLHNQAIKHLCHFDNKRLLVLNFNLLFLQPVIHHS